MGSIFVGHPTEKRWLAVFLKLALLSFVVVVVVSRYLPFSPLFPALGPDTLDNGWRQALGVAAALGLAFGKSIVFNYGPYASIATGQYEPATWAGSVAGSLLLGVAVTLGLLCLDTRPRYMLCLVPFAMVLINAYEALLLLVPLLALTTATRLANTKQIPAVELILTLILLMASLALITLTKGSMIILAVISSILVCAVLTMHRRWVTAMSCALTTVGALILFWLLASQRLKDLLGYFDGQLDIILGYSEAMASSGPAWQTCWFIVS